MPHQHDGKVLVYAPFQRDSESILTLLAQQGMAAEASISIGSLAGRLGDDIGAVVMSEEALAQRNWQPLIDAAVAQPSWSAYPFILMIGQRRSFGQSEAVYSVLPPQITNVMVLERPMGSATLVSAIRWALAGRRRQFLTRNHLDELERKQEQQRLMTRELAHRVKNTIAVLQSIVTQTMRPYPAMNDVKALIVERFAALSRAHDLLLGSNFTAANFRTLVTRSISVNHGNFKLDGPEIELSPQASLSFALVLHELTTNSIKYGALKSNGAVRIGWRIETASEQPMFVFTWRESGGPPVAEPKSSGFGSRLIRSTLSGIGSVDIDYDRAGFALSFLGDLKGLTHSVVPDFGLDAPQDS